MISFKGAHVQQFPLCTLCVAGCNTIRVNMCIAQFGTVSWLPHLSSGKLALIIATFLALVFGLDDLIGPARTNAWAISWLSASARFFTVFVRRVLHSAVILRIVAIVAAATIFAGVCIFAGFWFLSGFIKSTDDHMSLRAILSFLLFLVSSLIVLLIGNGLQRYFATTEVSIFLHDHSEYWEVRFMAKFAAAIDWAIQEAERDSMTEKQPGLVPGLSPDNEGRYPVHGVFMLAWLPVAATLIFSLVSRTAWLIIGATIWILVFAPAQALHAVAKLTGAENYIKVGKYVALVVMSIYGLVHD